MFKTKGEATIPAALTILGQGQQQELKLSYKHVPRSRYAELLAKIHEGQMTADKVALDLVDSWEADAELSLGALQDMDDHQPGSVWAIVQGYGTALQVALKGS